jgi:Zinc-binding dehydrogenase
VKEAFFIVESNRHQLVELAKLIDAGILRPIVNDVLPLAAAAQAYFPTRKTNRGKTVLVVLTTGSDAFPAREMSALMFSEKLPYLFQHKDCCNA